MQCRNVFTSNGKQDSRKSKRQTTKLYRSSPMHYLHIANLWNCISFKHISVALETNYTAYWVCKAPVFQFPLSGLWSTEAQIIKPPMWISVTLNVVLDEVTGINTKVRLWQTSNKHFFFRLWNSYDLTNCLKWHSQSLNT